MTSLIDFRLLSFDVYGTLIDYKSGILASLKSTLSPSSKLQSITPQTLLTSCHKHATTQQSLTPTLAYSALLTTIHPLIATELGLDPPTKSQSEAFGKSVGTWPAFPDTVSALHRLQKHYKLVVLSNVDPTSFSATNSGPLEDFRFDRIITASEVGSYKPSHQNFLYMLAKAKQEFGVEKKEVLQTAQSQFHDHTPAKELGIMSAWIVRSATVQMDVLEKPVWNWKFDSLGEMAETVEKEFEDAKASG